jgi:hypothetical protein
MSKLLKENSYLIVFALVLVLVFLTMNNVFAEDRDFEMLVITIEDGDTLWSIASLYHRELGMTIQDYIFELRSINELNSVIIHPGQSIMIPVSQNLS